MAKPDLGTMTIKMRIVWDITLWEAIKWRIAGREFRDELVKAMRGAAERDDGEAWRG